MRHTSAQKGEPGKVMKHDLLCTPFVILYNPYILDNLNLAEGLSNFTINRMTVYLHRGEFSIARSRMYGF